MFAIVFEQPIKLQKGPLYSREQEEQQTHFGNEIDYVFMHVYT